METQKMTYEEAFSRLEEISAAMSAASVPLDKLMRLYEEGMGLAAHCEKLLKGYEARLEKVSKQALLREEDAGDNVETADEEVPF
ncbi:MAG: exodeoxyribonuclease VII small subunit [Clostridia bacterium]|nr:exodeoxyribonuclease VII small subunit [Clostridia bacterium]